MCIYVCIHCTSYGIHSTVLKNNCILVKWYVHNDILVKECVHVPIFRIKVKEENSIRKSGYLMFVPNVSPLPMAV